MANQQGRMRLSRKAKHRGAMRKRRQHRAERRAATNEIRETRNATMRAAGHPGWR